MLSDTMMQILRQADSCPLLRNRIKSLPGSRTFLSCFQRITKTASSCSPSMHSCLARTDLSTTSPLKSSTVYKGHCITVSGIFCRFFFCKDHHRIVLMAGGSSDDFRFTCAPCHNRCSLHISLHRMSTVKC